MQHSEQRIVCPRCEWSHVPVTGPLYTGVYSTQCRHCGHGFNFTSTLLPKASVTFSVNGKQYSVSEEDSQTVLHSFLTERAGLRQSKYMCYAGGCGSCVVSATYPDPLTGKSVTLAVNSCLRPVYACDGWQITTTEGIGNSRDGFHAIQEKLADNNGSQCGWCSPGMVMSMYSYLQNNPSGKASDVEGLFDGNICRCTGYRAILGAMQSFVPSDQVCLDIEDVGTAAEKTCRETGGPCRGACRGSGDPVHVVLRDADWHAPASLQQLYDLITSHSGKTLHLLMGNTASAIYRDKYDLSIDIKSVAELYTSKVTENEVTLGSSVTLTNMVTLLSQAGANAGFEYCASLAEHLMKVANHPVRNVGTWAGNLVLKKMHPAFPSDIFVILATVGATLKVGDAKSGSTSDVSIDDFLELDLSGKVIMSMTFPKVGKNNFIRTFKVMARSQSVYAYAVMGFNLTLDPTENYTVSGSPRIVFGEISSTEFRATSTEKYLIGKAIGTNDGLQGALSCLKKELQDMKADTSALLAAEGYRKGLIPAMFYRYMLGIVGNSAAPCYQSGASEIERPLSKGSQDFDTDPTKYPLTEPMAKVAARKQASGEAEYIAGIPNPPDLLYGQFVLAAKGNCKVSAMDPSAALAYPGVVKFIQASDIPGTNNFYPAFPNYPEEVLCSGDVLYAGQALGIILAESQSAAIVAASMVRVTYTDEKPPILTIQDAITAGSFFTDRKPKDLKNGDAEGAIVNSPHQVSGEFYVPDQYHMHMETQTALCIPSETGMEVHASTQWPDMVQQAVATVTNTSCNSVHVKVRRLGGAYGAKISRNCAVSAGCGLAAHLTNRPVKMTLTLAANMQMLGKRFPYLAQYKVGLDNAGKLQGIRIQYYCDSGSEANECPLPALFLWADNAYKCDNWHLSGDICRTNKPANTWCRSPGSVPAIAIMEYIMEHAAQQLNMDPLQLKKLNLYQKDDVSISGTPLPYCNIADMMSQLETTAQIAERQRDIAQFNDANRWKKQGLGIVPLKFGIAWTGFPYSTLVSIFNGDGSVSIEHGGIEIGQGIHTKVMQVCAYKLGIPISKVNVVPTETVVTANTQSTGGSITSELCAYGVAQCCEDLLARINPVRAKMPATSTWQQVIAQCYLQQVDLTARYWSNPGSQETLPFQYFCYGACCTEVELDVLTGSRQVNRVDILYDCGQSMNAEIDIGQIEGAFIMGMGYNFSESLKYDKTTGRNLTDSTWEYHVPMSKDIPVDFRVSLLKNAYNPLGVLGSKAVAEPPQCMSVSVLLALKHAIQAARQDASSPTYFQLDAPATVDVTQPLCLTDTGHFLLH